MSIFIFFVSAGILLEGDFSLWVSLSFCFIKYVLLAGEKRNFTTAPAAFFWFLWLSHLEYTIKHVLCKGSYSFLLLLIYISWFEAQLGFCDNENYFS